MKEKKEKHQGNLTETVLRDAEREKGDLGELSPSSPPEETGCPRTEGPSVQVKVSQQPAGVTVMDR